MNAFQQELRSRLDPGIQLSEAAAIAKSAGLDHPDFEALDLGRYVDDYATVLFLDIRGFTRLSMGLSVGETARIVDAVVGAAAARLREYGAHINDFTGDGIMGIFSERACDGDRDGLHEKAIFGVSHLMAEMSTYLRPELLLADISEPVTVAIGLFSGDVRWQRVGIEACSRVMVLGEVAPLAAKYVTEKDAAKAWQTVAGGPIAKAVPERLRERCTDFERTYNKKLLKRERWLLKTEQIFGEAPDRERAASLVAEARRASAASMIGTLPSLTPRRGDGREKDHGVG
jgi:class 3 adenylate cyclase